MGLEAANDLFLRFLCCDQVFELFLLALEFSERKLGRRSSRLQGGELLLALLHETVAEDTSDSTDSEADPKIEIGRASCRERV